MSKMCSICGNTYKNIQSHQNKCKSPKKPGHNAAGQEEVSRSARDCKDLLDFDIVRRPRSSRDAIKDMDVAEALVLLQEQPDKDISSDDEPGVEHSDELSADNPDEVLTVCSDKRTSAVECICHPVVELEERLSSNAIDSSDVVKKDNQKLDANLEFEAAIAVITLMSLKPKRNAASVDLYGGTEKCANEALLVEEPELTHNDDGQGLVDCPENSAVMELKQPKLDLKVLDNSENPASDDATGKQTSLIELVAREADQEPEQKLDVLEEQAAKGTTSVDELGTDNPGEELGADNSDEVFTSCSGKSSCSVKSNRGHEITDDMDKGAARALLELRYGFSAYPFGRTEKSGNEAPVEEVDWNCKHIRQTLAAKSAAIELKNPKLDHEVLDNSVVMQEEEQQVDLVAAAPVTVQRRRGPTSSMVKRIRLLEPLLRVATRFLL